MLCLTAPFDARGQSKWQTPGADGLCQPRAAAVATARGGASSSMRRSRQLFDVEQLDSQTFRADGERGVVRRRETAIKAEGGQRKSGALASRGATSFTIRDGGVVAVQDYIDDDGSLRRSLKRQSTTGVGRFRSRSQIAGRLPKVD